MPTRRHRVLFAGRGHALCLGPDETGWRGECKVNRAEAPPPGAPGLAYLAGFTAVLIWAGWIVATRFAMTEAVPSALLALFRFGIPALILAPIWLRRGLVPRDAALPALILMTLGWGAPFVFWAAEGLKTVPAALFAPLVPGLLPIAVALLSWAVVREGIGRGALLGTGLMAVSVALILGQWLSGGDWAALAGVPFLLMGMLGWAVYAINFRQSGLSPLEATAYVGLYSVPIIAVALIVQGDPFAGLGAGEIAFHALTQGLVSGVVAVLAYGYAIDRLGVQRASALIALVPVCTAVMGAGLLGERLGALDWAAVLAASVGVAAANGAFNRLLYRRG